jgi:hypothetical protein
MIPAMDVLRMPLNAVSLVALPFSRRVWRLLPI